MEFTHSLTVMKTSTICSNRGQAITTYPAVALGLVFIGLGWGGTVGRAQPAYSDAPGVQVLIRGPVHEAFAGTITFNAEPGVVVSKAPPGLIEEIPPEERPDGDHVAWIPGYWAWDDERGDFLWISGTWRALPPGREWMAGYWGPSPQGYQWISGYWADASTRGTRYLPAPPATVEAGPNVAAPSLDYSWAPGCWLWYQGRYVWRPGYWVQVQADWDWIPAYYLWTPRGYIFIDGFWDYPVLRRGLLFAPVYFESGVYSRRGYSYSPVIVISLAGLIDHLFLRPSYHHYYFGDYYAANYSRGGYYASYSFQSGRYGYDPFYSRQRWEHRQDREWESRVVVTYQYRRDNVAARPPRTWAAQASLGPRPTASQEGRAILAMPIQQLAQSKESPTRLQPVARGERQKLAQRGHEVQQTREQRRTLEAVSVAVAPPGTGGLVQPPAVQPPRSPIVAKPIGQLGKNQTPPRAPLAPKPDLKVQPKTEASDRQPSAERSQPAAEPRQLEPAKKIAPGRDDAAQREKQARQNAEPRAKELAVTKEREEVPRAAQGLLQQAQQESERRAKDAVAAKAKQAPVRHAPGLAKKTQQDAEQRARELAAEKEQEEAQRESPPPAKPESVASDKDKDPSKPVKKGQNR